MRIAVFTDRFYPHVDGIAVHVESLIKGLTDRGHNVLLYAPKPHRREDQIPSSDKLTIHYLPSITIPMSQGSRLTFPLSLEVLSEVKSFNADVCHFHTPFMIGFQSVTTAKLLNIPLVGTFHTYFMEPEYLKRVGLHKIHLEKNKVINSAGWNYATFFYNRADIVISPSECTKKDLEKNHIKSDVQVVSNGIQIGTGQSKKEIKRFSFPRRYFLYVGRLSIEKSLDILIEAYALIADHIEGDLVIAGNGTERKNLEALTRSKKLSKRIHFIGNVEHTELLQSDIYDHAIAFITPSKSEIQPVSILEAIGNNLPIIGVDARGVSELIDTNGVLCPPDDAAALADAMNHMISDVDAHQKYCRESKKMAKKHSFVNSMAKLEKLYQKAMKQKDSVKSINGVFHPTEFLDEMVKFLDF